MSKVMIKLNDPDDAVRLSRCLAEFEGRITVASGEQMVDASLPEAVKRLELSKPLELHYDVSEINLLMEISEFIVNS